VWPDDLGPQTADPKPRFELRGSSCASLGIGAGQARRKVDLGSHPLLGGKHLPIIALKRVA